MLPEFPEFIPLGLAHRDEIDAALAPMERPIAELAFANLYLFRAAHDYRACSWRGLVLVLAKGYDGAIYAMPPLGEGPMEEGGELLCGYLKGEGASPLLFPVPGAMKERFFSGESWQARAERDQADYVYSVEAMAKLEGKKYQKRRNRLSKFLREHGERYEYRPFGPEYAEACANLARDWCDERCSVERPSTYGETDAAVEAALNAAELSLLGGVGLIDGEVAAFCLGEELNEETFVIHFEKSRPGIDGLAQVLGRDFCRALEGYTLLNREQDLGDPGLRRAKQGYHPVALAEKYSVYPAE